MAAAVLALTPAGPTGKRWILTVVDSTQGLDFPPSHWPNLGQCSELIDSNQSVSTLGAGSGVSHTKTKGWGVGGGRLLLAGEELGHGCWEGQARPPQEQWGT